MIRYAVNTRKLASLLAEHLRGRGYEARSRAIHLWATAPNAADPSEERLVLGGVIAAWQREHPDARIVPVDYEPPPDLTDRSA